MTTETYERLKKLHDKYGAQEFGKLCQKLLAISFRMAGYSHIVERGVQGVDVDAAQADGEKYAVEVKTTEKDSVSFGQKDVDSLKNRSKDGYRPVLAVLRLTPFSTWFFAKADRLRVGALSVDSLRPYRLQKLEQMIEPYFAQVVSEHFKGAMEGAQAYLDEVLRSKGADVLR